ncbi:ABC transporter permease [Salinibacterium sp. SYSU T00001]|uniref:ABC transporter permease n=1 Tax=Homoserinimonas sedimenticola TaxID=2986805 RepID=UPI00223627C3|nr:ABC transporter permease [Salinibacterium sedimenticola]MCW4385585.1 ABC transporter permease [Salinibacterium sedimenticola]
MTASTGPDTPITPLGITSATWLVADREIRMRLRSKAFLISTAILVLAVLASVVIGGIMSRNTELPQVAAVGAAIEVAEQTGALDVTVAESGEEAEQLVRDGEVEAAIVPADSPTGIQILALDEAPLTVVQFLSVSPEVVLLEETEGPDGFLIYLVSLGFGIVFLMSALTFGMAIAQSVVEEKQTRIVEILLATVSVRALLAGKVIGNSILALGQIVIIIGAAGIGMLASGQDILLADVGPSLVWFVVFFMFGFVLLASLFAAAAALVSRQEDMGVTTTPIMYLVMIPYFLVIFFNDNPLVLGIMSYVPFSAPVGMPMRIFLGWAEWWEPLLSLGILIASTLLIIGVGSRIYENGLLRMGARVKLKEALKG